MTPADSRPSARRNYGIAGAALSSHVAGSPPACHCFWLTPTPRSRLHLTAQAEGTPLEGLRDAVNAHVPLNGLVTGRLDLEGIRSNLAGSGVLRIEQGTIAQETFDVFSANLRVAGPAWLYTHCDDRKLHLHGRWQHVRSYGASRPYDRFISI